MRGHKWLYKATPSKSVDVSGIKLIEVVSCVVLREALKSYHQIVWIVALLLVPWNDEFDDEVILTRWGFIYEGLQAVVAHSTFTLRA